MPDSDPNAIPPVPAAETHAELVSLSSARRQLAAIWFGGSAVFLVLVIAMSLGPAFEKHTNELFTWAMPTCMPTLGLIMSVLAGTAIIQPGTIPADVWVHRTFFSLSKYVSIAYLVILIGGTVAIRLVATSRDGVDAVDLLTRSNYWLAPIQTIIVFITGTLFFNKDQSQKNGGKGARRRT